MLISSDRPSQSDRAGYRINHSPFVCHLASRGRITYILRGSPTIPSMIPMVLPDDTPTGCTPHGQTALAGILPSGFTSPTPTRIRPSIVDSRLPTPVWHNVTFKSAKTTQPLVTKPSQPMEPAFNSARRHGYPRCKTQVSVSSIRSRDHPIQGTFAFLDPVDTSLPGECARLVMTGRTYAARTPTLPSYYAATASRVRASPEMRVLNPQHYP
jgi:hypothetical protein